MTQPPSSITLWPMTVYASDPSSGAHRLFLRGTCSLIFEGQSFLPEGHAGNKYWLELSNAMRERLVELLTPLGWRHEIQDFEAEFYGTLSWVGHGCGHLGLFAGIARIEEIISVRLAPAPYKQKSERPLGIRGVIKKQGR